MSLNTRGLSSIEQLFVLGIGLDADSRALLSCHLATWCVPFEFLSNLDELHSFEFPTSHGAVLCCEPKELGDLTACLDSLHSYQALNSPAPIFLIGDDSLHGELSSAHLQMVCCILPVPLNKSDTFACLHKALSLQVPEQAKPRRFDILLVDENNAHQRYIGKMLSNAGHRVTDSSNNKDALAIFLLREFQVLIIDLDTAPSNGFEFARICRTLTENLTHKRPPFIIFTATLSFESMDEKSLVCADYFLTKPINLDALLGAICTLD